MTVDARFDNDDVLATAQDRERKDLQSLRNSLVGQRLNLLKRISFASDHIQTKNTSALTLFVTTRLVVKGRGEELITMVDTFIRNIDLYSKLENSDSSEQPVISRIGVTS